METWLVMSSAVMVRAARQLALPVGRWWPASSLPGAEKRALDSTAVSSTGVAGQGSCDGCVSRVWALGYLETPAAATGPA